MANVEHLRLLKRGVAAWNAWRVKDQESIPDLDRADLQGLSLAQVNFSGANLISANLRSADLSHADLSFATLHGANFRQAHLFGTSFDHADLLDADFRQADLSYSYFNGTALLYTDFAQAILLETIFADTVNLEDSLNLDLCIHRGPSVVDHRTLAGSGKLSTTFLRGCGLSDDLIEFYGTQFSRPMIRYHSCFISYSHNDKDFVERLYADLQNKGVRCWLAQNDLKIGDRIRPAIDKSIYTHDRLLLILSEHSITSSWVEKEVETAFEKEQQQERTVLFPIRLDDTVMKANQAWVADIRRTRHIGNFTTWSDHDSYIQNLERLLRDLRVS